MVIIYNISSLRNIYLDICSNYYTFRLKQNSTIKISTITKQIDYIISTIENRLLYLGSETVGFKTGYRSKRGLIYGLGSVIKAITGNLDQDDAIKIDNEIKQLHSSYNK